MIILKNQIIHLYIHNIQFPNQYIMTNISIMSVCCHGRYYELYIIILHFSFWRSNWFQFVSFPSQNKQNQCFLIRPHYGPHVQYGYIYITLHFHILSRQTTKLAIYHIIYIMHLVCYSLVICWLWGCCVRSFMALLIQ